MYSHKIKLTNLLILILILSEARIILSQPVQEWIQRYNGPGNSFDIVSKLLLDNKGNVYVYGSSIGVGSLSDMTIVKYNSGGNINWVRSYNGSGNSADQVYSAFLDDQGNSYIAGFTTDSILSNKITTAKYDSAGNLVWINIYQREGYFNGFGQSIAIDNSANVIVAGYLRNSTGTYDMALIKYSNSGNEIWSLTFNGEGNGDDIPVSVITDEENNIIVAGSSKSVSNGLNMIILKYNSSSLLHWQKTINGSANADDRITSIATDNKNSIYLTGGIYNNSSSSDYYFAKLNSNGATQWEGNYNGSGNSLDIPYSLKTDPQGNTYITGYSRSGSGIGTEDILTMKISPEGITSWVRSFNGNANGIDQGNSVEVDKLGNVYVGGASDRGNVQLTYALLKYKPDGVFEWLKTYSLAAVPEDFVYDVETDNLNNIYVTGISLDTLNDYDFVTIKYSQKVGVKFVSNVIPDKFILLQNYPNPFNPNTTISYQLTVNSFVKLRIYDILGNEVSVLVSKTQVAGFYSLQFEGSNLPGGIYYYKLNTGSQGEADDFSDTKKMVLIK